MLRELDRSAAAGRSLEATGTLSEPQLEVYTEVSDRDYQSVRADPTVKHMAWDMPVKLVEPLASAEDDRVDTPWGIEAISAPTSKYSGKGVVCAVLDTGIDKSHPAFQGLQIVHENFTTAELGDSNGHGTHCAGIFFGRPVNGMRIGVATGVSFALIGKVLDDGGSGTTSQVMQGLEWAAKSGANIISMSLGFDHAGLAVELANQGVPPQMATSVMLDIYRKNLRLFDQIVQLLAGGRYSDQGVLVIAAAGNESDRRLNPPRIISTICPADANGVISVGGLARGQDGELTTAYFSNSMPTLSAPGAQIVSARAGGGLCVKSGTSMAAPHVAGAAALWWERSFRLRPGSVRVKADIVANARPIGLDPQSRFDEQGEGIVSCPLG